MYHDHSRTRRGQRFSMPRGLKFIQSAVGPWEFGWLLPVPPLARSQPVGKCDKVWSSYACFVGRLGAKARSTRRANKHSLGGKVGRQRMQVTLNFERRYEVEKKKKEHTGARK